MTNTAAAGRFVGRDIYYGWVVLGVAALAMVGTLPGRTQGLGLITEPLLADLGVEPRAASRRSTSSPRWSARSSSASAR